MSATLRLADTLARLLGLPESKAARLARPTQPTNTAGTAMPEYAVADAIPSDELTTVRQPDGRISQYPPPERWDDWVEWESQAWPDKVARRYTLVPTICFNCESGCGLLAYVDKTTFEVRKFEGNPAHPGSRGRNCAKGPATHNQIYDPERILYPVKRVGKRGEGKWQRVSWEEALDDISAKMRASREKRRDGIMYHVGRPGEDHYTNRCIQAWGVDGHNSHTNVCSAAARAGYYLWAGFDRPSPDYANAQCILLISSHLETGHYFNPHAQRIIEAMEKGARLICLDPRLSNTASRADVWLPTWPGSEAYLLLAIARHLLETDQWDRDYVRRWVDWEGFLRNAPACIDDKAVVEACKGGDFAAFEKALRLLYRDFTFEEAARECRVDIRRIEEAAEAVARAGSRLAAGDTPGRGIAAAEEAGDIGVIREDPVGQHHALAAAMSPRAAVLVVKTVFLDAHPVTCLGYLDGNIAGLAVTDAELPGFAVLVDTGPPAAHPHAVAHRGRPGGRSGSHHPGSCPASRRQEGHVHRPHRGPRGGPGAAVRRHSHRRRYRLVRDGRKRRRPRRERRRHPRRHQRSPHRRKGPRRRRHRRCGRRRSQEGRRGQEG